MKEREKFSLLIREDIREGSNGKLPPSTAGLDISDLDISEENPDNDHIVAVAKESGQVVGTATLRKSRNNSGCVGYIENVSVRNQEIGNKLILYLTGRANAAGCHKCIRTCGYDELS